MHPPQQVQHKQQVLLQLKPKLEQLPKLQLELPLKAQPLMQLAPW